MSSSLLCQTIKDKGRYVPAVVGGSDVWLIGFLYDLCYANDVLESDPDFIEGVPRVRRDFSDPNYQKAVTDLAEVLSFAQDGWASTPTQRSLPSFVNDMSAMMSSPARICSARSTRLPPDFDCPTLVCRARPRQRDQLLAAALPAAGH